MSADERWERLMRMKREDPEAYYAMWRRVLLPKAEKILAKARRKRDRRARRMRTP